MAKRQERTGRKTLRHLRMEIKEPFNFGRNHLCHQAAFSLLTCEELGKDRKANCCGICAWTFRILSMLGGINPVPSSRLSSSLVKRRERTARKTLRHLRMESQDPFNIGRNYLCHQAAFPLPWRRGGKGQVKKHCGICAWKARILLMLGGIACAIKQPFLLTCKEAGKDRYANNCGICAWNSGF
jgi:hypothetical protein